MLAHHHTEVLYYKTTTKYWIRPRETHSMAYHGETEVLEIFCICVYNWMSTLNTRYYYRGIRKNYLGSWRYLGSLLCILMTYHARIVSQTHTHTHTHTHTYAFVVQTKDLSVDIQLKDPNFRQQYKSKNGHKMMTTFINYSTHPYVII